MRVLVTSHLFPDADKPTKGLFVEQQVRELVKLCDVRVFTPAAHGYSPPEGSDPVPVHRVCVDAPRFLPGRIRFLVSTFVYAFKLARHIRESGRPDLIHAHFGFPDGVVAVVVAGIFRLPVVITLHGSDVNVQLEKRVAGWIISRVLARATHLIFVSDALRARYARRVSRMPRASVLPNGYASDVISVGKRDVPTHFLFIGSLTEVKNPGALIEAYAGVAHEVDLPLKMVGDGPLRSQLEHLVLQHNLGEKVEFLGVVSHTAIPELLRGALALVLPSVSEGMPIVVLESLASGTPVIASAVGGIPEVVNGNHLGVLVEPGDVESLAAALIHSVRQKWDSRRISEEAPILSWEENVRLLEMTYAQTLQLRDKISLCT